MAEEAWVSLLRQYFMQRAMRGLALYASQLNASHGLPIEVLQRITGSEGVQNAAKACDQLMVLLWPDTAHLQPVQPDGEGGAQGDPEERVPGDAPAETRRRKVK